MSERGSLDDPFGEPVRLPDPVNSAGEEGSPFLSPDGLNLFLSALRPGALDPAHIVMFSRKTRGEPFGRETVLGAPVNTAVMDVPDWVSADGRVLVTTKMVGNPPFKTVFHVRPTADAPFGPAQSFGPPVERPSRPWLSSDGRRMYFHSREVPGGHGNLDLWVTHRVPRHGSRAAPPGP
jgi:peptidoglycan-associated lipoprotein